MRADAFITLNLVQPVRKLFPPKGRRVPILMYHSISNRPEQGRPYYRTVTSPEVFAQHMRHLHEHGYSVVSLSDALGYLDGSKTLPSQPVVITFDDGYADFYTEAFPVLSRYGFTATVYLPTAFIGQSPKSFKGIGCLTWSRVRELHAAGIEFGSHTVTHPQLTALPMAAVQQEIRSSKEEIESRIGTGLESFSYPYAFPEPNRNFRQRLRGLLMEAGYKNGVSTILGTADSSCDRLFLARLPVNAEDDAMLFKAKLFGAYAWLHAAQVVVKQFSPRVAVQCKSSSSRSATLPTIRA
jgi:peptidoglycan/xylan/chitin deacetylase (PgdA/CDA1 family)